MHWLAHFSIYIGNIMAKNPDSVVTKEFLQNLIDIAVKYEGSVTFVCPNISNAEIREMQNKINLKFCHFLKKTPEATLAHVCPPCVLAYL